jgi:hypothetical protein
MTRTAIVLALGFTVAACAGSGALDRSAHEHEASASTLEAQDRYADALREREAADDARQDHKRYERHDGDNAPHPLGIGR